MQLAGMKRCKVTSISSANINYTLPLTYRHSTDLCIIACNIPSLYAVVLIPVRLFDVFWEVPAVQHLYNSFVNRFTSSTTYYFASLRLSLPPSTA